MAFARSASLWVSVLLMLFLLHKTVSDLNMRKILISIGRIILVSAVAALIANYSFEMIAGHLLLRLAFALLCGSIGYLLMLIGMKIPEYFLLRDMIKQIYSFTKYFSV